MHDIIINDAVKIVAMHDKVIETKRSFLLILGSLLIEVCKWDAALILHILRVIKDATVIIRALHR